MWRRWRASDERCELVVASLIFCLVKAAFSGGFVRFHSTLIADDGNSGGIADGLLLEARQIGIGLA